MKTVYKYLLNNLPRPLLIRLSYVFKLIAPLLYKGNKVYCPVCKNSFRKFLSYGSAVAHRDNVLCPFDLTLERHRLMWYFLENHSEFFKKERISVGFFRQLFNSSTFVFKSCVFCPVSPRSY